MGFYGYKMGWNSGLAGLPIVGQYFRSGTAPTKDDITEQVFFDLSINAVPSGRVVLGLYGNLAPKTVQNFRGLCVGDQGNTSKDVPRHFLGTKFHRIIPDFMIQGGDYTNGNGTGGESIWGGKFNDENLSTPHQGKGTLAMANAGPNTNGSQFYICTADTPWLNGKHVVFGHVIDGLELVDKVGRMGDTGSGRPTANVVVTGCGVLKGADQVSNEAAVTAVTETAAEKEERSQQLEDAATAQVMGGGLRPPVLGDLSVEALKERLNDLRELEDDLRSGDSLLADDSPAVMKELLRDVKRDKQRVKDELTARGKLTK